MTAQRYRADDGATLAYALGGDQAAAATLLFVHGWQGTSAVWEPLRSFLAGRFRTLTVDLRGMGASNGAPGPYRVERFARDLGDLVDALGLDPVVAVGHSMGGAIVQRFAVDRPEAVLGLVLIASVPASAQTFPPALDGFFRATIADPAVARRWVGGLTTPPQPPETTALLLGAAASASREAAMEAYESWTTLAFGAEAATIETPTLVIAPAGDRPMTPALARELVADPIAGSRFEELPACRHYAPLDRPAAVAELIAAFVDEL